MYQLYANQQIETHADKPEQCCQNNVFFFFFLHDVKNV
jgi:hypothetical protein